MARRPCGDPNFSARSWNLHRARRPRKRIGVPRPSRRFRRYLKQRYIANFWARWLANANMAPPPVFDDAGSSTTMESQVFGTWGDGTIPASDFTWDHWEAEVTAVRASGGWPRWEDSGGWGL
ncbi:hypothetical protein C8F04DRAFT_1273342 [Mycena alexandri]|uniref:Uncharacterized protein n=1 Tax=Mycena alexandri TaxID=1745969 RepID=A0AAD6S6Z5_9AGAR|nr:hypothetical protein C8F04DRAFT_1276730 [Mycena alexandri]KAJ7019038.1 hypothetical protein C8F04DRAFT_1276738 [Mycena alexandri]KAJ7021767.1 hypothetical protein C8F04DRAFT_1273342 [Mycena alexandri]